MMLSVWNEQLAAEGEKSSNTITDFVKLINNFSAAIQNEISGEKLRNIVYAGYEGKAVMIKIRYTNILKKSKTEIDLASAQVGVQRDDLHITINGSEAKIYGSQGQQRYICTVNENCTKPITFIT